MLLQDGSLGTVDRQGFRISWGEGKTWSDPVPVCEGLLLAELTSRYLLRIRSRRLVMAYLNFTGYRSEVEGNSVTFISSIDAWASCG